MKEKTEPAHVAVEIHLPNGGSFGPEEVALIDAIRSVRSIIGASRAEQLDASIAALDVKLDAALLAKLNEMTQQFR